MKYKYTKEILLDKFNYGFEVKQVIRIDENPYQILEIEHYLSPVQKEPRTKLILVKVGDKRWKI